MAIRDIMENFERQFKPPIQLSQVFEPKGKSTTHPASRQSSIKNPGSPNRREITPETPSGWITLPGGREQYLNNLKRAIYSNPIRCTIMPPPARKTFTITEPHTSPPEPVRTVYSGFNPEVKRVRGISWESTVTPRHFSIKE